MSSLLAGYRNEVRLMTYRRKTTYFLLFSAILPILLALAFHALGPRIGWIAVSASFPIQILSIYTALWIPLFLFLSIADIFPHEVASKTLKLSLLRPITRFRVYMAKTLVLFTAIAAIFLLLASVSIVCNLAAGSSVMNGMDYFDVLKAYLASFISMCALAALFVFVAQLFQSVSGFVVFAIVLYAVVKVLPYFVKGFSAFSIASYTDWYVLWLAGAVSVGKIVITALFILSALVLFLSLGFLRFDRKEA
ncbi:ABC transporter permease [Cohnella candidum]|uniref:ABC transporter permease n=1 Tax=Cohnella candidum TaxID=2674991 RepID=A0A3G3JW32_9BACL|nr:ABC transporter permease [Cohnella candidum]AYQ72436.1 ABC transporter permease [Cohnella candidum]